MNELSREFNRFVKGKPPGAEVCKVLDAMLRNVTPVDTTRWRGDAATVIREQAIVFAAARGLQPMFLSKDPAATAAALGWLARRVDLKIAAQWTRAGIKPR